MLCEAPAGEEEQITDLWLNESLWFDYEASGAASQLT